MRGSPCAPCGPCTSAAASPPPSPAGPWRARTSTCAPGRSSAWPRTAGSSPMSSRAAPSSRARIPRRSCGSTWPARCSASRPSSAHRSRRSSCGTPRTRIQTCRCSTGGASSRSSRPAPAMRSCSWPGRASRPWGASWRDASPRRPSCTVA
jgi:hypothetical protein